MALQSEREWNSATELGSSGLRSSMSRSCAALRRLYASRSVVKLQALHRLGTSKRFPEPLRDFELVADAVQHVWSRQTKSLLKMGDCGSVRSSGGRHFILC